MMDAGTRTITTTEYTADDPELDTMLVPLREVLRLLGELNAKRDDEIDALRRLLVVQESVIAKLEEAIEDHPADEGPAALH